MPPAIVQSLRSGRYRHVVFSGGLGGHRPANLGQNSLTLADLPAPRAQELCLDQAGFLRWLFRQGGLDVRQYRPETLGRRIRACLRAIRVTDLHEARLLLERNPSLVSVALSAIVLGVSSFFRDENVFDYLIYHVLPTLPYKSRQVRIWSAGCSEGQEPYSLAMLLSECGLLDAISLLATDCRADAISRARDGAYEDHQLRGVPGPWLTRHFTFQQDRWTISPRLRQAVQFRQADVLEICEPGGWDLILCRNVGMYLRPQAAGGLWQRFEQALLPGGFLVLGKAERPLGASWLSAVAPCVYRRDRG